MHRRKLRECSAGRVCWDRSSVRARVSGGLPGGPGGCRKADHPASHPVIQCAPRRPTVGGVDHTRGRHFRCRRTGDAELASCGELSDLVAAWRCWRLRRLRRVSGALAASRTRAGQVDDARATAARARPACRRRRGTRRLNDSRLRPGGGGGAPGQPPPAQTIRHHTPRDAKQREFGVCHISPLPETGLCLPDKLDYECKKVSACHTSQDSCAYINGGVETKLLGPPLVTYFFTEKSFDDVRLLDEMIVSLP